jgi:hypothetical protein
MASLTTSLTASQQTQSLTRGVTAYVCDVCKRSIRVPINKYSVEIIHRCIITKNCLGKLHRIITAAAVADVPATPPAVPNVVDWTQRRVYFLHEQTIENQVWLIEHNLANHPNVQTFVCVITDGEEVLTEVDPVEVRIVNLNTIEVEFDRPRSGIAQCLAFASTNTVNPSVGTPTVVVEQTTQLTNNGELTIATLDDATLIDFTIRYNSSNSPTGIVNVEYVGVDDQPSLASPWAGTNQVYINGRTYTVRSFNLVNQPLAPAIFADNLIRNGTQFFFPSLSTEPNRNLIIYGTSPFTVVDRVVDRYIDIGLINQDQPEIAYTSGEAFAASSIIRSTYPHIHVVD